MSESITYCARGCIRDLHRNDPHGFRRGGGNLMKARIILSRRLS